MRWRWRTSAVGDIVSSWLGECARLVAPDRVRAVLCSPHAGTRQILADEPPGAFLWDRVLRDAHAACRKTKRRAAVTDATIHVVALRAGAPEAELRVVLVPEPPKPVPPDAPKPGCKLCGGRVLARGLCSSHYQSLRSLCR